MSGDSNRPSAPLGTFNPLFPTGFYFGEGAVNLNGPSNMLWIGPSVVFDLRKNLSLGLDYDFFWRECLGDGIYALGVNLLWSATIETVTLGANPPQACTGSSAPTLVSPPRIGISQLVPF
jgi:Alginate export